MDEKSKCKDQVIRKRRDAPRERERERENARVAVIGA